MDPIIENGVTFEWVNCRHTKPFIGDLEIIPRERSMIRSIVPTDGFDRAMNVANAFAHPVMQLASLLTFSPMPKRPRQHGEHVAFLGRYEPPKVTITVAVETAEHEAMQEQWDSVHTWALGHDSPHPKFDLHFQLQGSPCKLHGGLVRDMLDRGGFSRVEILVDAFEDNTNRLSIHRIGYDDGIG